MPRHHVQCAVLCCYGAVAARVPAITLILSGHGAGQRIVRDLERKATCRLHSMLAKNQFLVWPMAIDKAVTSPLQVFKIYISL